MLVLKSNQHANRRPVTGLAFSPDGARLAATGNALNLEFWNVVEGTVVYGPWLWCNLSDNLRFDPSGRWLLGYFGTDGLRVLDMETWRGDVGGLVTRAGRFDATGLTVSRRGRVIARTSAFGCFDVSAEKGLSERKWTRNLGAREYITGFDFLPDGARFVSVDGYMYGRPGHAFNSVRIRSAADGSVLTEVEYDCPTPECVKASPDGDWIAIQSERQLSFHRTALTAGGSVRITSRAHFTGIAFHPSGRFLAATNNDATVRLHDRDANWTVTRTFDWKIGKLKTVTFSPDGGLAAAGGEKGQIVVWDVDF